MNADFDDSDESGPMGYAHRTNDWDQQERQLRALDLDFERKKKQEKEDQRREQTSQRVREIQEEAQLADEIWGDEERRLKYDIELYRRLSSVSFLTGQEYGDYANVQTRLGMKMMGFEIPETDEKGDVIPFYERVEMLLGGEEGIEMPRKKAKLSRRLEMRK